MYDELVVVGGKIYEAYSITERNKKKYVVRGLGVFFDDEIRRPKMTERFLYLVRAIRKVG